MQECFGDVLVLIEEVVEMCFGQKCCFECKFFLGYVLVQIEIYEENGILCIDNESWYLVKDIFKVMGFIGGIVDCLLLICDEEVVVILDCVQEGVEKFCLKVLFELGQMVCVIEGLFNDFNGVVEEVNYEKSCLCVLVLIFGCVILVEFEFGQVEKVV